MIFTGLLGLGLGALAVIPPYMILVSVLTFVAVFYATRPGRRFEDEGLASSRIANPTEGR